MLYDFFKTYLDARTRHLNCAETTLLAASSHYDLGATLREARYMAAFGGGMGCGNVCGALVGAISALGLYELQDLGEEAIGADCEALRPKAAALAAAFEQAFGSSLCSVLKPRFQEQYGSCDALILETAKLLEAVIEGEA